MQSTMETRQGQQLVLPAIAVGPANRNGHAQVIGRIVDLFSTVPPSGVRRARTIRLSRADERLLRDADDRQLRLAEIAVAREGDEDAVRAMLARHFHTRFGLMVTFGASETSAQ